MMNSITHIWDAAFFGGSIVAAFMQGITLSALVQGIEVADRADAGGWWDWLNLPRSIFSVIMPGAVYRVERRQKCPTLHRSTEPLCAVLHQYRDQFLSQHHPPEPEHRRGCGT